MCFACFPCALLMNNVVNGLVYDALQGLCGNDFSFSVKQMRFRIDV